MKKWERVLKNPRPWLHPQWVLARSFGSDQGGITKSVVTSWSVLHQVLFFFQPVANRDKLKPYFSRQGLQNPQALEDLKPDTLATFPAVCVHFTSFPWVAAEPFRCWLGPMPFLQRVGGSPLAEGKPSPAQPQIPGAFLGSRPLRFPDLR